MSFFKGFSYNFVGFRFFKQHKSLWKFVLLPVCIDLFLLILLMFLYLYFFNDLFHFLTKGLGDIDVVSPQGVWEHTLDGLYWFLRSLLQVVLFVVSVVVIFVSVFLLSQAINAPFYEAMAEKILILKGYREDHPFSIKRMFVESTHALKIEGAKLVFFTSVSIGLLLLSWIPVVGFVFFVLGLLFSAWTFALALCAFPMVIERKSFQDILAWAKVRKLKLIGFGMLSLIPFLGLLLAPFQVVGGTLLFLDESKP